MTPREQEKAAKKFANHWSKDCKEDGNTAPFWMSLLHDLFGVEDVGSYIQFEDTVKHEEKGNALYVDAWIPSMRVMIEQKATGVPLDKPYKRHGKTFRSVYEQAFEYDQTLPVSQRSKYIIACNFHEFWIYNMDEPEALRKPMKLTLEELPEHFHQLDFLIDKDAKPSNIEEVKVSVKAGELVGKLYDAFIEAYKKYGELREQDFHALNVLCVRIVFCLYAEDSGLFGRKDAFGKYLASWKWENGQQALDQLFQVLDTKEENRSRFLDEKLSAFPYVNGGLFHDAQIEIPPLTEKIYHIILDDMSRGFDWSVISPTIFGAVFESTLNPETRRSGGMHYTSIANIHKVIDPLFLTDLKQEFQTITAANDSEKFMANRKETTLRYDYRHKLEAFQKKLSSLTFLDPACGSGNFLTETFISLRRLENEVIRELTGGQQILDMVNPIEVSISQFYGIEINDFAVTVAKTALWIAESQMMKETEDIIRKNLDFLPLKTNAFIHEGNALRMDWESVVPKEKLNYIMGNPPFVGYSLQSKSQKADILSIYVDEKGKPYKTAGKIDYVAGWYFKAAELMQHTEIETAFVSTNSITQGEQVAAVWKPLYERFGVNIHFAWRTFRWDSEASEKAHVHVVIIGFCCHPLVYDKWIYNEENRKIQALQINPYLLDAPTVFIESRNKPICNVLPMTTGNRPADGGALIIEGKDYSEFIKKEPKAIQYIKQLTGSEEYINHKKRYCLWLVGAPLAEIRKMPLVMKRIALCRENRLQGAPDRQKLADTPMLFREQKNPKQYIIVPRVSSERRRYIPLGFLDEKVIPTDSATIIENATLYELGILSSNVHMAWVRAVAGRLKSDYRYSKNIVYNNFPWPHPTDKQKARIEQTAQGILDARANHPGDSLADLYDPLLMPPDLRKAHIENDKAVMDAYGFNWRTMKEEDCVAELMKMYQALVGGSSD